MADVQTSEMNVNLAPLKVGPWNYVFWQIFRGRTTFNKTTFVRIQKYQHSSQFEVKIHLFYWENSWTVAFNQMKFSAWKDHENASIFYSSHHFLWRSFWIWRYLEMLRLCWYNAELLCVEFCNFVQYHKFVSCSSYYCFIKSVLNIIDINTEAEKYSTLCRRIHLFIFIIYNLS
jgi:hypothetical protein